MLADTVPRVTASVGLPAAVGKVDHRIVEATLRAVLDGFKLAGGAGINPRRIQVQTIALEDGSSMIVCEVSDPRANGG